MQSSRKKKLIIANSFLMLLLICGFVYAWFAVNYNNNIESNNIKVTADKSLELSIDDSDQWKSSLNLSTDTSWFNDVKFTDITGLGDGKFTRPTLEQFPNYADVFQSGSWTDPINQVDYVKFTLHMRSLDPLTVSLGENSSVYPVAGMSHLIQDVVNKSPLSSTAAPFSKDIVAGAVRISAINNSGRLFTWIPRPDINVASTNKAVELSDITINNISGTSFIHNYYDYSTHTIATAASSTVITGDITSSNTRQLIKLQKSSTSDYYEGAVDVCIWLEGTDNEARRAFVDGEFVVDLSLTSVDTPLTQ